MNFNHIMTPLPLQNIPSRINRHPLLRTFLSTTPTRRPLSFNTPFNLHHLFLNLHLLSNLLHIHLHPLLLYSIANTSLQRQNRRRSHSSRRRDLIMRFPTTRLTLSQLQSFTLTIMAADRGVLAYQPSILYNLGQADQVHQVR